MKFRVLSTVIVIAFVVVACGFKKSPPPPQIKTTGMFAPVAVLELFTSQGCSSCPPADALLAQTVANAKKEGKNILALSFHVDYWNRLGWADPFSSNEFSQRQSRYVSAMKLESAYTPQMVVNGSTEFVGSDESLLTQSLSKVLNTKAEVNFKTLTATFADGKPIKVAYSIEGNVVAAKINFALVSLNETTVVKRGENAGHTLTSENIVRQLITKDAASSGEIEFTNMPVAAKSNTAVIAFVQQDKSLKIIGGAMAIFN